MEWYGMTNSRLQSRIYLFLLFFASLSLSGVSVAQEPWSGIISPGRAVDWQNAGATISTTRTQCGSTVAAGTSASSINSLLSNCASGTYLLLGAGTFNLNSGIAMPSNVTLRGSGASSTFLAFSSGVSCRGGAVNICAASADTNYWGGPSNSASWTGTNGSSGSYAQGATSILLSSTSNLKVGNPIILDQIDDQKDNGGLYVGCEISDGSKECYSGAGPSGFQRGSGSVSTIRGQQQVVKVTSISGNTVGITPAIYANNWRSSQSPGAWWASSPLLNVGIENLSIDSTGDGSQAMEFFNCQNCWVKGVRSVITRSGLSTGWFHVGLWMCNHCTVRDSYFYGNEGDSYQVSVGIGSDNLVENNIVQFPSMTQFLNSDCEGCVAGYNFSPSSLFLTGGSNWLQQSSEYHSIALYTLAEGNIGAGHYGDSFHGTHVLNTIFRNRFDGHEQDGGTATASNTNPIRLNPGARYYNIIGNVLGSPGYHNGYKTNTYTSVYSCGAYGETGMTTDTLSCSTSVIWGNWDSVNDSAQWSSSEVPSSLSAYSNLVPSAHTLPASLYYASKPSWWPSGKAWPPIGPDVTGGNVGQCNGGSNDSNEVTASQSAQCSGGSLTTLATVNSIPAMDCYFNVMGGKANGTSGPLTFNPSSCYAGGGSTGSTGQPGAPVSLTATVE
jgi:hypothetical protein